jgi:hypothetical protein
MAAVGGADECFAKVGRQVAADGAGRSGNIVAGGEAFSQTGADAPQPAVVGVFGQGVKDLRQGCVVVGQRRRSEPGRIVIGEINGNKLFGVVSHQLALTPIPLRDFVQRQEVRLEDERTVNADDEDPQR